MKPREMHLLDRVYSLYENLCRSFQTVCRAGCSLCCTSNVTLTTLEGTVIIAVRPFACRCMVSAQDCSDGGSALMDPFWVTINTLFMQIIEHMDAEGFTGNLVDVLIFLDSAGDGRPDPKPSLKQGLLVPNLRVPALMIPPEHRERIGPVINALKHAYPVDAESSVPPRFVCVFASS